MKRPRRSDVLSRWLAMNGRGAALLTVLMLVAVMAVLAAVMLDRLNLATRLAANAQAMAQARLYAFSAENIVASRLGKLVSLDRRRTVDRAGLLDRESVLPLARGTVAATVRDAGNCFNVNALSAGPLGGGVNIPAIAQLRRLMEGLDIPPKTAAIVSDSLADWIDEDQRPMPNGAEDAYYLQQDVPYRTPGQRIADLSELRAVRGMSEPVFQRLRPWLCALPSSEYAVVNLNTLRTDQVRLVTAMVPDTLGPDRMRAVIAARPAIGWDSVSSALGPLAQGEGAIGPAALRQLGTSSRWFEARLVVSVDSVRLEDRALIDARLEPARIVARSWGEDI